MPIVGNNTGDWESRISGCGCTGGGKFWDVRNVRVTNNYVHDNKSVGLWADTNDNNFLFEGNWIENNDGEAIFWEIRPSTTPRTTSLHTWIRMLRLARATMSWKATSARLNSA